MRKGTVKHAYFSFFLCQFRILNYTFQQNIEIQFCRKSHYIISGFFYQSKGEKTQGKIKKEKKPTNKYTKAPEKAPTLTTPPKNNPTIKYGNTIHGKIWMAHPG